MNVLQSNVSKKQKESDEEQRNVAALQTALQANRDLQQAILIEQKRLADGKARNRSQAVALRSKLEKIILQLSPTTSKDHRSNKFVTRQWNRLYFVDSDGISQPAPNPDTKRRRQLERETAMIRYLEPPWSNAENKELKRILEEQQQNQLKRCASHPGQTEEPPPNMDWEQVARVLSDRVPLQIGTVGPHLPPRTAAQCRIQWQNHLRKAAPFSKDESEEMVQLVESYYDSQRNQRADWQEIAQALQESNKVPRTAFDCYSHYYHLHSHKKSASSSSTKRPLWTPQEDELLLLYVAAAGPQFVVDAESVKLLAGRLLPNHSQTQLLARINDSLVNPNLKRDFWTEDEERKLAILMKVYRDKGPPPKDLQAAASHFVSRSNKSVSEKWQRSLNPSYNTKPFTPAEDERLLEILRQQQGIRWIDLSEQYFPDRHPQRLANRWADLATDQDILVRTKHVLVNEQFKKQTNASTTEKSSGLSHAENLTADDFVVHIKKRRKS